MKDSGNSENDILNAAVTCNWLILRIFVSLFSILILFADSGTVVAQGSGWGQENGWLVSRIVHISRRSSSLANRQ